MAIINIKNTAGDWEEMPALQGNPDDFINLVYPVGSIYMSVNDVSPSTLFGGTWEKIEDTFLLASGSTFALGQTGGEKTHALTINEIPSHEHSENITSPYGGKAPFTGYYAGGNSVAGYCFSTNSGIVELNQTRIKTDTTGGDQPHNNMPPYLVVNIWKRIS